MFFLHGDYLPRIYKFHFHVSAPFKPTEDRETIAYQPFPYDLKGIFMSKFHSFIRDFLVFLILVHLKNFQKFVVYFLLKLIEKLKKKIEKSVKKFCIQHVEFPGGFERGYLQSNHSWEMPRIFHQYRQVKSSLCYRSCFFV